MLRLLPLLCLLAAAAHAATVTTPVSGQFNNSQENACIHVSTFYYLTDCAYTRLHAEMAGQPVPWTGPTVNPVYYPVDSDDASPRHVPAPGDARIAPAMDGELLIDDRGTPDAADDLVSGTLVVGPAARSVVVNVNELAGGPAGRPPRAVMTWTRIVHTLEPTPVNSATPNDQGGYDYVIASKGFPRRLCLQADAADCYPSAHAGLTTDGQAAEGTWDGPAEVGVTRGEYLAGNVGASTTAVIEDYQCVDNRKQITCPNHNVVWSTAAEPPPGTSSQNEGPGFDNLLLKIVTGADGRVRSVAGFWTNEYRINAGPKFLQVPEGYDNSWQGGYLALTGAADH